MIKFRWWNDTSVQSLDINEIKTREHSTLIKMWVLSFNKDDDDDDNTLIIGKEQYSPVKF